MAVAKDSIGGFLDPKGSTRSWISALESTITLSFTNLALDRTKIGIQCPFKYSRRLEHLGINLEK